MSRRAEPVTLVATPRVLGHRAGKPVKIEPGLSADNGQTWASAEDAELLEVDFDEPAPYLRARLTLGAIVDDPQDATPRYGYEAQTLESLEITAGFDDTPLVINHQDRGELGEVLANIADQIEAVYEVWQDGEDTLRMDVARAALDGAIGRDLRLLGHEAHTTNALLYGSWRNTARSRRGNHRQHAGRELRARRDRCRPWEGGDPRQ